MLLYKIDVISELAKVGINTTIAKNTGIFGQETMRKFRNGDTKISLDNLNRLCAVLEMQPRDIIKYVETDEDRKKYISKISEKLNVKSHRSNIEKLNGSNLRMDK